LAWEALVEQEVRLKQMDDLLRRASSGDQEAFGDLLDFTVNHSSTPWLVPAREVLVAAEIIARLGAAHGSLGGRQRLAGVLIMRAHDLVNDDPVRADTLWFEAASILYELAHEGDELAAYGLLNGLTDRADRGDEECAQMLNGVVETLPPATLRKARKLVQQTKVEGVS
jgi:hypothetical protein